MCLCGNHTDVRVRCGMYELETNKFKFEKFRYCYMARDTLQWMLENDCDFHYYIVSILSPKLITRRTTRLSKEQRITIENHILRILPFLQKSYVKSCSTNGIIYDIIKEKLEEENE